MDEIDENAAAAAIISADKAFGDGPPDLPVVIDPGPRTESVSIRMKAQGWEFPCVQILIAPGDHVLLKIDSQIVRLNAGDSLDLMINKAPMTILFA